MRKLCSNLFLAYFFVSSAVLWAIAAVICILTFWWDRNRVLLNYFSCAWGYHYMWMNPNWRCEFTGLENLDRKATYVMVANHQSHADILVLYGLFFPFKWVSKESIFDIPFVGWNLWMNQGVYLKRGDRSSIRQMMQECKDWLERKASVMIFAEGTRSEDGEIHQFRDGAFRLSCENKVLIAPIVIDGTHNLLPKRGGAIDFSPRLRVRVLPPVSPADYNFEIPKMRDGVHGLMAATLAEMRGQEQLTTGGGMSHPSSMSS